MSTWQLQQAKARFSELIHTVETEGPQTITRRGIKTAVVVPIDQWERSQSKKPSLLEVLQSGPQFDLNLPARGRLKSRPPVKL